jgi:hypothetical protein
LISLALPTEARHSGNINGLAGSLGKCGPIDLQSVSGGRPKPADPPENRTAAPTDIGSGGKEYENGGDRCADFYRSHPILATHFGLAEVDR